jgi:hypothetical protein
VTDPQHDTQPRRPFPDDLPLTPTIDPEAEPRRGGRGCLMQFLIGGGLLLFATAIVALAGLAGWTNGQREANRLIAATRAAAIDAQLRELPNDVASGNMVVFQARLQWLATQTPGVASLPDLMLTGTALYLSSLPTPTPTASPTPDAPTPTPDAPLVELPTPANGGYDPAALFAQAQAALGGGRYQDAIDLLDVVIAIDPNFQTGTVRSAMSQALNLYARQLYNAGQPAAANLLVNRAEEFGPLLEGLSFERYAAELYLTGRAGVSTGSQTAINALNELIGMGAGGRYYTEARSLLYNAYVRRGDSFVGQGNPCAAIAEFQRATQVQASGVANGRLAAAQASCAALSAPTADPNWFLTPGAVAPIGVVPPPGG